MSHKTALVLLTTLIVGALLWSALTPPGADQDPLQTAPRTQGGSRSDAHAMLATRDATPGTNGDVHERQRAATGTQLTLRIRQRDAAFEPGDVLSWQLDGTGRRASRGVAIRTAEGWVRSAERCSWDEAALLETHPDPKAGVDLRYRQAPAGRYQLVVGIRSRDGDRSAQLRPQELRLVDPLHEVDVWLEGQPGTARLGISCMRGGVPYAGPFTTRVLLGGLPLDLDAPGRRTEEGWLVVPADASLEVHVEAYPGMSLFPAVPAIHVKLEPGEERSTTFVLPAGRPVGIQCMTPHGERIGASLALWRFDGERQVPVDVAEHLRVKKDTWWGYLPPGKWFARMGPQTEYASAGLRFETTVGEQLQVVKVSAGTTGRRVRLQVRDDAGRVIEEGQFNLNRISNDAQQSDFYIGSLTQGQAVTRPLPEGEYWLFLWGRGYARRVQLTQGSDVVLDEQLPPPLAANEARPGVRGRIVDHARQPLGALRVLCRAEDSPWHWMTRTTRDGSFAFEGLAPGAYEVVVPGMLLDERMRRGARKKVLLTKAAAEVTIRLPPR